MPELKFIELVSALEKSLKIPELELQRDRALSQVVDFKSALAARDTSILGLEKRLAVAGDRLITAPTYWTVVWVAGVGVLAGLIVGGGAGFVLGVAR